MPGGVLGSYFYFTTVILVIGISFDPFKSALEQSSLVGWKTVPTALKWKQNLEYYRATSYSAPRKD